MATTALGLTEKQRAIRPSGIGASEIAAVAGLHPTRHPIDVYLEKVGEAEPFEGNAFTEWGHRIERVVAEAWQDRHPDCSIFTPGTLRHRDPRFPFAFASPDRIVVPPGRRARDTWRRLLEIKNVSIYQAGAFGNEGTDEIPEHMICQVQWQLEVVDLEEATLVPLIGGHDFREYPIARDREMGSMLLEVAERFWREHVEKRVPPPLDGSDSYGSFLSKRFPREQGPLLAPSPETVAMVERLRAARAAKKAAEAEEEFASQAVKVVLGDAAGIAGLCTWKANKPGQKTAFDAMARALHDTVMKLAPYAPLDDRAPATWEQLVASFTTTKPGARVLRLSKGE